MMAISEKKIKSVLKQGVEAYKKKREEQRVDKEDPSTTTQGARDIVDQFIENISNELDKAGNYVRPGLKKATKNYLMRKFEEEV